MKKNNFISICILLGLLLSTENCSKNNTKNKDSELPPLTFEGNNTIGCKINGEPWVPKGIFAPGVTNYPTRGGYYIDPFYPNVHILLKTYDPEGEIELFCRNYSAWKSALLRDTGSGFFCGWHFSVCFLPSIRNYCGWHFPALWQILL